jgi:hypothetical protein
MQGESKLPKWFRFYCLGALGGILVVSWCVLERTSKLTFELVRDQHDFPIHGKSVDQGNLLESAKKSVSTLKQQLHDVAGASSKTRISDVLRSLNDLKSQLHSYDKPMNDVQEETARAAVSALQQQLNDFAPLHGFPASQLVADARRSVHMLQHELRLVRKQLSMSSQHTVRRTALASMSISTKNNSKRDLSLHSSEQGLIYPHPAMADEGKERIVEDITKHSIRNVAPRTVASMPTKIDPRSRMIEHRFPGGPVTAARPAVRPLPRPPSAAQLVATDPLVDDDAPPQDATPRRAVAPCVASDGGDATSEWADEPMWFVWPAIACAPGAPGGGNGAALRAAEAADAAGNAAARSDGLFEERAMLALLLLLLVLACLIGGFSCMGCAWAFREYRRQDGWRPAPDPMHSPRPAESRALDSEAAAPPPPKGRGRGGPGKAAEPAAGLGAPGPAVAGEGEAGEATAKAAQGPAAATAGTGPVNRPAGSGGGGPAIQPRSGGAVGVAR